jgi:hypothetical protein
MTHRKKKSGKLSSMTIIVAIQIILVACMVLLLSHESRVQEKIVMQGISSTQEAATIESDIVDAIVKSEGGKRYELALDKIRDDHKKEMDILKQHEDQLKASIKTRNNIMFMIYGLAVLQLSGIAAMIIVNRRFKGK